MSGQEQVFGAPRVAAREQEGAGVEVAATDAVVAGVVADDQLEPDQADHGHQ